MASQWERLLKNQGVWQGSFTRLSPQGEVIADIPTEVSLKAINQGDTMHQVVRKMPLDQPPEEQVYEYGSLGKGILFFEDGAFSQGSIQLGPFGDFGAELGFIAGDRRLRLVLIFQQDRSLKQLTLIREKRAGTDMPERSPLTMDALYGIWQGEAVTLYPDLSPAETYATTLAVQPAGADRVKQTLHIGENRPPIQSEGTLQGTRLLFDQGSQQVQVLLLPDGASATCPVQIQARQPLFLEVGWLLSDDRRQRLIRSYNAQGGWVSLTLVTEQRI
ncbi:MAG: DUF3598 family protein [Cyanobacteria bacterium P01_A01_bin.123]